MIAAPEMVDTSKSLDTTLLCCDLSSTILQSRRVKNTSLALLNDTNDEEGGVDEEERKCPMCYSIFPINLISIDTFEQHVINHFEQEDGYEVLS